MIDQTAVQAHFRPHPLARGREAPGRDAMLARQRPAGHESVALDLPSPFGEGVSQADRLAFALTLQIEVSPVEERRSMVLESTPDHVEAFPARRNGAHGRCAGRAVNEMVAGPGIYPRGVLAR